MIATYFADFLAFFFPEAHAEIDWARSYETLDKELHQIAREARLGKRLADKLVKVWLKSGEEEYILIHIEIQGRKEGEFGERMFVYNYRVFDVYRGLGDRAPVVVSFAILADDSEEWNESEYTYGRWGSRMSFEFKTVKLRDYNERWADLEADPNPFATVTMAFLKARETRKDPQARLRWKSRLCRRLYEQGLDRDKIVHLFRFIDWVLSLPEELEKAFWDAHLKFEAEKTMRYVTSVERIGMQKGLALLLKRQIQHRFMEVPPWAEERLAAASTEDLETWGTRVLDARSLEEVFATG